MQAMHALPVGADSNVRPVEEVRARLVERLDHALRRPEMWAPVDGLDGFFEGLLRDLAFIDEVEEGLAEAIAATVEGKGLKSPVGMRGPLAGLMSGNAIAAVIASLWADVAWRFGWLHLDARATPEDWEAARIRLETAVIHGLTGAQALALLEGPPSFEGREWFALVAEDGRWLYFDLDVWRPPSERHPEGRYVPAGEARVRHVRVPAPSFAAGLLVTPHAAHEARPAV